MLSAALGGSTASARRAVPDGVRRCVDATLDLSNRDAFHAAASVIGERSVWHRQLCAGCGSGDGRSAAGHWLGIGRAGAR
jgi:hypothetical protein